MKVILFGATGMIGQGALRECLRDGDVERVLVVGRTPLGQQHDKLREVLHQDFLDFTAIEGELAGYDACLFCLGVSSGGMTEEAYHRVTYEFTLAAARTLAKISPAMTFIYVSGAGTDSSERGKSMWARVKGKTENALLALPFKAVYLFRPAYIQPLDGITSKTRSYRVMYAVLGPLYPVWKTIAPRHVTTTESMGRAMLAVVKRGADRRILENHEINALA